MKNELTAAQIRQFHDEGYVILPAVFNGDEVRRMREEADFILERTVNAAVAQKRRSWRLDFGESKDGSHVMRKIQPINALSLFLSQVSADERLIGPMRQLMEDEPILMEEKLNYKQKLGQRIEGLQGGAGAGRAVPDSQRLGLLCGAAVSADDHFVRHFDGRLHRRKRSDRDLAGLPQAAS